MARVALLVVACGAAVSAFVVTRRHDRADAGSGVIYICPMHPEVTARQPGICPICGMAIEKIRRDGPSVALATDAVALNATELSLAPIQTAGSPRYSTDIVRRRVLHTELFVPAWRESGGSIAALLYKDELPSLTANEPASFLPTAAPNARIDIRATDDPPLPWDRSMSLVHFRFADGVPDTRTFPVNQPGWVKLVAKNRDTLVVPSMAILFSAEGPYVLVMSEDRHTFTKRPIEIGRVLSGFTAVVAGVSAHELIVSINTFFVEAERRLRSTPSMIAGAR